MRRRQNTTEAERWQKTFETFGIWLDGMGYAMLILTPFWLIARILFS